MVSIGSSAFLDLPPAREGATSMQLRHNDATLTGTITGVVDAAAGLVEVSVDGSTEPPVVAASAPGLTFLGAKVKLPRDSSGRVTQVSAPTGQAPEGVEVVPVGETGVRIHQSALDLRRAEADLEQAKTRMRALDEGLSEATQAVAANHAQVVARLAESSVALAAAQSRADAAASEASAARDAAVAAAAKALGAQSTADQAAAKASTADGRYTVASKNPTAGDATGKPEGAVWEVRSGSTSLRRFVLQGSSWVQVKVGADFVGENAIGATLIEPGAITTPKLAAGAVDASKINASSIAAGIARFLQVTTDQIVAGNVKIAGELLADVISGKVITGSKLVMDGGGGQIQLAPGESGLPQIRIVVPGGGLAILDINGLKYWSNGVLIGSQSWRALISPAMAVLTWDANYGMNAPIRTYWTLGPSGAKTKNLYGGMAISGDWLQVPIAGWYQIEAAAGFHWAETHAGWAVAMTVWRESDHRAGRTPRDLEDPTATLPLIQNVTTRPTAMGLMKLAAGEKIAPAFWQSTGSWRPNSGTSRFVVRLIDEL